MLAIIQLSRISGQSKPLWSQTRVLYAYLASVNHEILYIGKADGTTVRQRWTRSAKEGFWADLEKERRILRHGILAGEIELEKGYRLTRELLADIESLLIKRISPWGNIQSRWSRILRPGLRVICKGEWPLKRRDFRDISTGYIYPQ